MKVQNVILSMSIALSSTSALAAAGDQLSIANGYASSVTTYHDVISTPGGFWATGITYDASSDLFRPVVTAFASDGTKIAYNTGGWSNGSLVITDLTVDATSTAPYYPVWGPVGGGIYLAVATPTSIESYTVAVGTYAGITHPHTFSFPYGVVGGVSAANSGFLATSARQTSGGVLKGVLIRPGITGFGTNGVAWITAGTGATRLSDAVLCDTNYICAVGAASDTGSALDTLAVKVSLSSGAFATAFDGDGKARFNFAVSGQPNALGRRLYMDGTKWIVLSNICNSGGVCDQGVARLTSSGALDTTFSGDGKNVFDMGGYSATAVDLTKYTGTPTRFYITGQVFTDSAMSNANSFIFAFTTSGTGDTSYGTNGLRTFNNYSGTGLEGYTGTAIASDGSTTRLFVVGDRDTASGTVDGVFARHAL